MTKLNYLVKNMYALRPSASNPRYEEILSELIQSACTEYLNALRRGETPETPIVLNLKETVYFDLTFSISDRPDPEKKRLISAFALVIRQAAQMLSAILAFDPSFSRLGFASHLGDFLSYTQFWETQQWESVRDKVLQLQRSHRKKLVTIAYRLLHSVILYQTEPQKALQLCERLFDTVGFISLNEMIEVFFEDVVEPSGFHAVRFEETYFPTLFLLVEFAEKGRTQLDHYLDALLRTESDIFQKTIILRTILDKLDDIYDDEVLVFGTIDRPELEAKKSEFREVVNQRIADNRQVEMTELSRMPVSTEKWGEFVTDIKNEIYFEELKDTGIADGESHSKTFTVPLPKRALVESGTLHLMRGFSYSELIDRILYEIIDSRAKELRRARDLSEIDTDTTCLLLPTAYLSKLGVDFGIQHFPSTEKSFFEQITVGDRSYSVRWIPYAKKFYAFNGIEGNFAVNFDTVQITEGETRTQTETVVVDVRIHIDYVVSPTFETFAYIID